MRFLHRYFRGQLHRRLFLWFGASILITGLAVVVVMHGPWEPNWRHQAQQVAALLVEQLASTWDAPEGREALAAATARRLDLDLVLTDSHGHLLGAYGKPCARPGSSMPVMRDDRVLGYVRICSERRYPRFPWRGFIILAVMGTTLWAAAGFIARRLSKPLWELSRVAQELGAGRLSSRMQLSSHPHGKILEIRLLSESFNDMASRIERQVADQRELLAAVSHELRTPLARIRLLVEILRTSGATGQTLDELDREVVEIDSLVGELLASSRLDFGALSVHPLNAGEVARRALERAGLDPKLLQVETEELDFEGDANLLARALANVIENATRHGGGLSGLKIRSKPGFLVFEAQDRGTGFAPGEEQRVFQAFYRPSNERRAASDSLGLGLALVRRIAEAHRGLAYAANRPEGGAVVGFEVSSRRLP